LPAYDRSSLQPTVVHIGPGVFHRAHQAVYADDLLRSGARDGAIWAVSLRSADVHDALAGDDFRYPLVERTIDGSAEGRVVESVRTIGSILGITVATGQRDSALARLVEPEVTVVTISVTEKGYCAVEPGGPLDLTRPEIEHDLADPTEPRSLPGLLVEALHRRRSSGIAPFTIVSCDNLPSNGSAVARVVGPDGRPADLDFKSRVGWLSG
jgi:fructuronate reductase